MAEKNFHCCQHKMVVEVHHSKESLHLFDCNRLGMALDSLHPVRKWPNTLGSDIMAKELDLRNFKLILLLIDD